LAVAFRTQCFIWHCSPPMPPARQLYHRFSQSRSVTPAAIAASLAASYGCGRNCNTACAPALPLQSAQPTLVPHVDNKPTFSGLFGEICAAASGAISDVRALMRNLASLSDEQRSRHLSLKTRQFVDCTLLNEPRRRCSSGLPSNDF
jgi:hypothetical protein